MRIGMTLVLGLAGGFIGVWLGEISEVTTAQQYILAWSFTTLSGAFGLLVASHS